MPTRPALAASRPSRKTYRVLSRHRQAALCKAIVNPRPGQMMACLAHVQGGLSARWCGPYCGAHCSRFDVRFVVIQWPAGNNRGGPNFQFGFSFSLCRDSLEAVSCFGTGRYSVSVSLIFQRSFVRESWRPGVRESLYASVAATTSSRVPLRLLDYRNLRCQEKPRRSGALFIGRTAARER